MSERKPIPYTERKFDKAKKQNYDDQYKKENLDRIEFTAPKGTKEEIKTIATSLGLSTAEFIRQAIDEKINKC